MEPTHYQVHLTEGAERDLEELLDYIATHDAPLKASQLLDKIEAVIQSLATFPERGSYPPELIALGMRDYRQTLVKPYRMIYRVAEEHVTIYLIADTRRDMRTLLQRRLLGR